MLKNVHQGALEDFLRLFQEIGARIHRERVIKEKASLTSVMNALTEACYKTLGGSIASKMILAGLLPASQHGLSPEKRLQIREKIAEEIMKIISVDLGEMDPTHDRYVAIVKRERRGPKK